jgi:hypothetical protein
VTLTCSITVVVFAAGAIVILFYVLPRMFGAAIEMIVPEPHVLVGHQAQVAIESYVGITLADATDFYYYDYYGASDSQSQMRFAIAPARLNQILAAGSLCFGTQLTPAPIVFFVTPIYDLIIVTSDPTPNPTLDAPTLVLPTPYPTLDFDWMTPPANHQYAGNHCSKPRAFYYNIRVDQTNPQLWMVWIQGYRG